MNGIDEQIASMMFMKESCNMLNSMITLERSIAFAALAAAVAFTGMADQAQAGPGKSGHHDSKIIIEAKADVSGQHGGSHDHGPRGQKTDGHGEHGGHHMNHANMAGGMPGKTADVSRKILVIAKDNKFNLGSIQVKSGQTIKFVIKNKGELVHEFTIGSPEMQKMHQELMMKMMDEGMLMVDKIAKGASHSHPNSVVLEPGESKEIIWMFHKSAEIEFGCNVPGHYAMGMKGKFLIAS